MTPLTFELLNRIAVHTSNQTWSIAFTRQHDDKRCFLKIKRHPSDPLNMFYWSVATPAGEVAVNNLYSLEELEAIYLAIARTTLILAV